MLGTRSSDPSRARLREGDGGIDRDGPAIGERAARRSEGEDALVRMMRDGEGAGSRDGVEQGREEIGCGEGAALMHGA